MKKKILKELPELLVTQAIRDAERKDAQTAGKEVFEYVRFYRAAVHGDILQVAIFTHESIQTSKRPMYTVFIDRKKDEHVTLTEDGKWRTGKINSLQVDGKTWTCTQKEWSSSKERRLVNEYFGTRANANVYQAVLDWQSDIGVRQLKKRWQSEVEQIDTTMKEVPEAPKDLNEWIRSHAFDESVFYMKNSKRAIGYCTHCGNWVDLPGIRHGEKGKCPRCRHEVTWRSWKKQKAVEDEQWVGVLQRLKDKTGYILRGFYCKIKWRLEDEWKNPEMHVWESYRTRLGKAFEEKEQFEWGEWKNTGVSRWCHPLSHGFYGCYERFGKAHMYTANLKRELKTEPFANVNMPKLMDYGRTYVAPAYIMQRLYTHPYLEYLQKAGLHRLTDEIVKAQEYTSCFDREKTRINEVLKLDKQRYNRLKEWNGGSRTLYLLQIEQTYGGKIMRDLAEKLENEQAPVMGIGTLCKRTGLNVTQQLNYLMKQMDLMHTNLRDTENTYVDYLNMAEDRGMDIKDDIVRRQKKLREYHDRYAEERNATENKKRDKEVNRKFFNIAKNYEENTEHFAFETENLVIVVPRRASDITVEGRKQHHCVGASDMYLKRMDTGESYIVFLRYKDSRRTPYYTIEIKWDGEINQWYGAYDRKPDEKKIEKILKKYTETIETRCREQEDERIKIPAAV